MTSKDFYNVKVVNDVIYNENTHIVSVFKDYLIFDDISEFLKRGYDFTEAQARLPKIFEFYGKYSKVFPNYVVIPENKYMFKNIERKQRQIDEKQRGIRRQSERKSVSKEKKSLVELSLENKLFDSSFMDKVLQTDHSLTRSSIKRSPPKIVIHMDQSRQLQESLQKS